MNNTSLTPLSSLGEFGLIRRLTRRARLANPSSCKGVGDDAAVLDYNNGKKILVSTDMLVEGIHFDLAYVPLKHLGYKAVAVNASDIHAMNGVPRQITLSIAVSSRFTVEALDELYDGVHLACERYDIDLVGGDTTTTRSGACISITIIGEVAGEEIVYRDTARANDIICVSGDLGAAYAGLQLLEREKRVLDGQTLARPAFEGHDYILERQLKPEARGDVTRQLRQASILPTAMIDISDGLSSELLHVCNGSRVGCRVYAEKIPVDPRAARFLEEINIDPLTAALSGGEDYELLFTIPLAAREAIAALPGITMIGYITPPGDGCNIVARDGSLVEIKALGWTNFKSDD
ncbi:MAG: thiamine-phosphate kinase [Odoribacteraceae bacterium]|nr:thiamine-phosphate kinase [Odoribacteraceae bacterium]